MSPRAQLLAGIAGLRIPDVPVERIYSASDLQRTATGSYVLSVAGSEKVKVRNV